MAFHAVFHALAETDLNTLRAQPDLAEALFSGDEIPFAPSATLDLGAHWHGVHYLLCGRPKPGADLLSRPILGGAPIGEDPEGFTGFGPARCFAPDQVRALAEPLSDPHVEVEARQRFSPNAMNRQRIHPGWQVADGPTLIESLQKLRAFYAAAASHGEAIVTCVLPV